MKSENMQRKIGRQILLLAFAAAFLVLFAFNQSPISQSMGSDTSFFKLVGQGMTQGKLPYRDYFDMKGPYLFLLQYLGQLISWGNGGIFLIELINLYAALYLADKIHRTALGNDHLFLEFALLAPYAVIAALTFNGGNLTEEYSLVPVLLCMYLYIRHIESCKREHPPLYAGIYGLCFGYLAFIRITNAASICAIVLCAMIHLLAGRRFRNLLMNALGFILGMIIAILPVYICCEHYGIWKEMLSAVFKYGFSYASDHGLFDLSLRRWYLLLPLLLFPPVFKLRQKPQSGRFLLLALVNLFAILIYLNISSVYTHNYAMIIPHVALGAYLYAKYLRNHSFRIKPCLCYCLAALILTAPVLYNSRSLVKQSFLSIASDQYLDNDAIAAAELIPEEDKASVFAFNLSSCSRFYYQTGITPPLKFCDWHQAQIRRMPEIADEIAQFLEDAQPKWIVTETERETFPFMETTLKNNYSLNHQGGKYLLWQRRP